MPKLTKIEIIDDTDDELVREGDDREWGERACYRTNHYIRGFKVGKEYGDLDVAYEIDEDKNYYLLYVLYTTGDSFGYDEGRIEFVGLYRTAEEADANVDRIEKHCSDNGNEMFTVELISPSGTKYKCHTPWKGYFNSIDDIRVDTIRLIQN